MNAYCPECETDLDPSTGICPACRWDPLISTGIQTVRTFQQPEMSLTERYRGSQYDFAQQSEMVRQQSGMAEGHAGISRVRAFVIVGLVAAATLYGLMLSMADPF